MDSVEDKDTYVIQLKEVFDSCDTTGSQCLNESELLTLCRKLHLVEHSNFLVFNLISKRGLEEVKFEDFKNCFVALLSQTIPHEDIIDEKNGVSPYEDNPDREVSPKFTFGRKKYGRRSRPASIADDGDLSITSQPDSNESSPLSSLNQSRKNDSANSGKRPSSPIYGQQPPLKSGRLASVDSLPDSVFMDNPQPVNTTRYRTNSEDISSSFENSPVEYLQQTWKKLGIGSDGYLTVAELALVCEHIGMDMTEEVIAQLFEKLDCDQDGRISFEEFLQGLFQHGEPQSCESSPQKTEISHATVFKEASRDDPISVISLSGIFTCLDSDKSGYADVTSILELWESLELPCSPRLLEELGFNTKQKINLYELTSVLEEELINSATTPLGQLAFLSYQNELNYLRQINEQICTERNKLHVNIDEANARAALLAQEVDDNHAKLESALQSKLQLIEKKYQEQIRDLVEELQQERDALTLQSNKIKQQLQTEIQSIRDEEFLLKNRVNILEQENSRLELELQEMTENYLDTKNQNDAFQKELLVIPQLKERLVELESHHGEIQERHHEALLIDIERYKNMVQELQDKIDELTLEIENLHQQNPLGENALEKVVSRTHSWLSDYKKGQVNGYKRRGSDSSDDNSDDEIHTSEKIRRTYFTPDGASSLETTAGDAERDNSSDNLKKTNCPSAVDVLIRDLYVERENLIRKLYSVEESKENVESMNKHLKYKCRALNRMAYDIVKATVA